MTKIGILIRKIIYFFKTFDKSSKKYIPVAVNIVQGIKTVTDGVIDDVLLYIVKWAIPGPADDIAIDSVMAVVKEWLPKILLDLKVGGAIEGIEGRDAQLKAVILQLNISEDAFKDIIYHGLAALILEKLSDGEITWTESLEIVEAYYKIKKPAS